METQELFYPEIGVQIGSYALKKGIEIETQSDRDSYFDWARIRFTPEFQEHIQAAKKEEGSVYLGYDGIMEEVFQGYVMQPYNTGSGIDEILLKDRMILLEETSISETFMDATPQEIIQYCLTAAGVMDYSLSGEIYQPKKVIPISRKPVIAILKEVNSLWGIRNPFFFSGGVFYWGTAPKQEKIYSFEYGVNIISLSRVLGEWVLETISAPFIKHSHRIQVTHPKLTGEFVVSKVVFKTSETGFIRTSIRF
ncbi:serine/arginine repetitive matrix protein 2 [Hungatella effluvii]|uniref:serine/arginine repetitive matrix protein 2 n=1 Tax=Hungatella effluvii TaxID=1096246 RepID=UPI0022DEA2B7|nr:serine/arginine repetitive matrix protein 2 [Hungatella effluvii]